MKENKSGGSGNTLGVIAFFAGLIVSLIVGWVVFPNLLYSQKTQPMNFSHVAHQDTTCEDCHVFRDDGTYGGIPKLAKCKECHESQMGQTKDEQVLVEEYVQKDREIPWHVYAYQPDNVYFSHAAHKGKVECVQCHRDVGKEKNSPTYFENRLTGYSKQTMKMDVCEKCHAEKGGSNNCEMCHK
jgi:menaquinone reductase, multiheme cytochrome c subunit